MKANLRTSLFWPILLTIITADILWPVLVNGVSKNVWIEDPVDTRESAKKVYRCGSGTEGFLARTAWPEGGSWTWYGATLQGSATAHPSSASHEFTAPEGPCTVSAAYNGEVSYAVIFTAVKLDHVTEATTPTDRARTTVGIAERVDLTITPTSPVTWYIWPTTGAGTLSSQTGATTRFSASRSPSNPEIYAIVGEADALQAECILDFTVIPPNGVSYNQDNADCAGYPHNAGPPNNFIGNGRVFPVTLLPTTVSFYRARLREHVLFNMISWPDNQTVELRYGSTPEFAVNFANATSDQISESAASYSRLSNGQNYVDFSFAILIPLEYLNEDNAWTEFVDSSHNYHQRLYRANGGLSLRPVGSTGAQQSSYRGPWSN
jgi:hypothetical protein